MPDPVNFSYQKSQWRKSSSLCCCPTKNRSVSDENLGNFKEYHYWLCVKKSGFSFTTKRPGQNFVL